GVAVEVFVRVGQQVERGTPLFRLDDRMLQAELKLREAALGLAQAQLLKLEQMPRPEELPAYEARVREAEATLSDLEDQLSRYRVVFARGAGMGEEMTRREKAADVAKEQLRRARAEFNLMKAGAWDADKAIAQATVLQAAAQLQQTKTDLDRLVVRALVDGEVLQVNVRPGEYVGAQPGQALIILG
ncbi:MAG TPA: biotin/lipoyl-binding protein, partial [Gemmatales bacterium]|nr:biotin/lipoyl-binding protein [Gemmatales bacterium]